MVWRMAEIGRLIVTIVVSIAILLSPFGLPVIANGSQNSGQSNPGGYVKYTLILANNTLVNGNFVNTGYVINPFPWGIAYDPSNGYIYVADWGWSIVSVINGKTVIATIPVGTGPVGIAYDPSNGYLYVTN
jgi:YVTN family beta-propeller protein